MLTQAPRQYSGILITFGMRTIELAQSS